MKPDLGQIRSSVDWTFDCMEIAERALKNRDQHGRFALLMPTPAIGKIIKLYEKHVSELMNRLSKRLDTRPATKAEMLGAMVTLSMDAPLNNEGMIVYEYLFHELFPGELDVERSKEQWSGQLQEAITVLRRKLEQPWRRAADGQRVMPVI